MRRRTLRALRGASLQALLALTAITLAPVTVHAADIWFLMGRHGECAPIGMLQRKFPDLGQVADPEAFLRFVAAKGLTAHSSPVAIAGGSAVEVRVPAQGLALLFVAGGPCAGGGGGRPFQSGER